MPNIISLKYPFKGSLEGRLLYVSDKILEKEELIRPRLVYFKVDYFEGVMDLPEPSIIHTCLPISDEGESYKVGYNPSYFHLNKKGRYDYVAWLHDITQPCDVGFLFIYLYGLERHILTGDIDKAFDEILMLRQYHKNKSFLKQSLNSMIYGCIKMERYDLFKKLDQTMGFLEISNLYLELKARGELSLDRGELIGLMLKMVPLAKTPTRSNYSLFDVLVKKHMKVRYNSENFPWLDYVNADTIKQKLELAFSNHSFPRKTRFAKVHDFLKHGPLVTEVAFIFQKVYDEFKLKNKKVKNVYKLENKANLRIEGGGQSS